MLHLNGSLDDIGSRTPLPSNHGKNNVLLDWKDKWYIIGNSIYICTLLLNDNNHYKILTISQIKQCNCYIWVAIEYNITDWFSDNLTNQSVICICIDYFLLTNILTNLVFSSIWYILNKWKINAVHQFIICWNRDKYEYIFVVILLLYSLLFYCQNYEYYI